MKRIKRFASLLLAMIMVLAMGLTAFAEESTEPAKPTYAGKITVDNATNGQSYTLYKVFDAKVKDDRQEGEDGISYSSTWFKTSNTYFEVDAKGNITATNAAKGTDGKLTAEAIAWLKNNTDKFQSIETKVAVNGVVEWTGLDEGYYYISTTTGTAVTVTSITPDITVQDKNEENKIEKTVSGGTVMNGDTAATDVEENTASIGDELTYKVTLKLQPGSENVVFYDTLESGLTLGDRKDLTVSINDANYEVKVFNATASQYEVSYGDESETTTKRFSGNIIISFNQAYLDTITAADTEVTITYKATVNANAETDDNSTNDNTANLTYGHNYDLNKDDMTKTHVFKFQVIKDDNNQNILTGAEFKLYGSATGNDQIPVVEVSNGVYRVAETAAEKTTNMDTPIKAGTPEIKGLKNGTYWVEETKAPDGYNKLTERKSITISGANNMGTVAADKYTSNSGGLEVVNQAGVQLPSTGGIGTTIFYVIGGILVIGAGILLVTKKRMSAR